MTGPPDEDVTDMAESDKDATGHVCGLDSNWLSKGALEMACPKV